jgi:hypothetical protein
MGKDVVARGREVIHNAPGVTTTTTIFEFLDIEN